MSKDWLIFDLDGTISDPKDGIVRSFNYALQAFGMPARPEAEIAAYIGPPLDQTFIQLVGSHDPGLIQMLVAQYRERYAEIGYRENQLYPGIPSVLEQLAASEQYRFGVCTSKRADFAEKILEMFGLREQFEFVSGGDIGVEKWQQLEGLRREGVISQQAVMIGDRAVDITAGQRNGLQTAGVLWGYGSVEELSQVAPTYLFEQPAQLAQLE
ncbi:HAD hydrolase-like protein [Photobacterium atrarenae]|uniref:HAD hydrolase-like protein n=1 Tax=Photobacterium atrarenae TaxID=865757 RepID=A0ABY5GC20_9GAMM|nr:HAD hydrolase-like protein [Photobacterium atrarenae]UTV26753.1 HAD hydrolase-like protein [Photobacterium atrarenae]